MAIGASVGVSASTGTSSTTAPIPGASSEPQGFAADAMHALELSGKVAGDGLHMAGLSYNDPNVLMPLGIGAAYTGIAAGMGTRQAITEGSTSLSTIASKSFDNMALNSKRITPTLVSAVAGPAIADGVSMLAPNILPKYKKEMQEPEKKRVQLTRLAVGGATVALLAAGAFLIKPDLFKRAGFFSKSALEPMLSSAGIKLSSSFTNQVLLGTAGGVGGLLLANKLMEGKDDTSTITKLGVAGGLAAAGAFGGSALAKALTQGGSKIGFLPQSNLFAKPNKQWLIDYGKKVLPLTAIPAGTAASQYFNIVSDFEKITSPKSPFANPNG